MHRRLLCLALLLLSACGGLADRIEFAGTALDARDRNDRVAGMVNTAFASMPVTGSADYTGHATLVFGPPAAETVLLGAARVTADFSSGDIAGRIDTVFGGTGLSDLQDYAGALVLDGGIGLRRPNSFDAVIAGTLTGDGQVLALSGPLIGDFRGVGGRAVVGITTQGLEATLNGAEIVARLRLVAEQ